MCVYIYMYAHTHTHTYIFRMRVERYILYFTHLRMLSKTVWTYFFLLQMNSHESSSKSCHVQKEVEVIKGISPNSAKIKTLSLVEYQEAISKLIFSILGELVPGPRWIPKSKNVQVSYMKCSQMWNPWVWKPDCNAFSEFSRTSI